MDLLHISSLVIFRPTDQGKFVSCQNI